MIAKVDFCCSASPLFSIRSLLAPPGPAGEQPTGEKAQVNEQVTDAGPCVATHPTSMKLEE